MAQPYVDPCSEGVIAAGTRAEVAAVHKHRGVVLAACVLASSMAFIDGSALTVALPRLRADLNADLASVQWVLNGYVLALAALTLIGGALADVHGKARMLGLGCLLFGAASIACALAPDIAWLIGGRLAQGIAAALLTPASLALIGATYPEDERSRAIGVWAAASALVTAGGPVLGGWLTEHLGWRAVFWINPPLAVVAVALLLMFAPADRRASRRFDLVGAAILAAALGALAWALSRIGAAESSTDSPVVVAAVAGLGGVGLIVYALWERASSYPMTPPRLAANHTFLGLNLATMLLYGALSIMFFLLPFELVDRRGLSPTTAGLVFLPFTLGVGLLSRLFGGWSDRIGARVMLIAGSLAAAGAYAWLALARAAPLVLGILGPMVLLGMAFAAIAAPITAAVLASVGRDDEGLASGINNAASRIAQLAGVAVAAGVASRGAGYDIALALAVACSLAETLTLVAMMPSVPSTGGAR